MNAVESAAKILDSMLGHLGYIATIDLQETHDGPCLQINSTDSAILTGKEGERLDDLQYLVNRILKKRDPEAIRVKVDCAHFRSMQEEQLAQEIKAATARVKASGKSFEFRPLNAYYRRLVYNFLLEDLDIVSSSPPGNERLKRITISLKSGNATPSLT